MKQCRREFLATLSLGAVGSAGCTTTNGDDEWELDRERLRWRRETDGRVPGSPIITQGRLYVGSLDGNFYSLDLSGGTPEWTVETGGEIWSSPTHYGGNLLRNSRW